MEQWMEGAPSAEPQIARPVDPPRGHSRPGKALGVTWEIAVTLGATVATGDSPEAERLAAHRWAWLARDPAWKQLFETAVAAKLADHLVVALPEERHVPLCAEVLEGVHSALWSDGNDFDRLKARALLHRSSGRAGCDAKCASHSRLPPAPTPAQPHPGLTRPSLFLTAT